VEIRTETHGKEIRSVFTRATSSTIPYNIKFLNLYATAVLKSGPIWNTRYRLTCLRVMAPSGCGWRRRPSDTEYICEYIEWAVTYSRKWVVLWLGSFVTVYYTRLLTWKNSLDKRDMWIRARTSGRLLLTRLWTFGFHKMWGNSW
jgi:hypothetical protein